MSLNETHLLLTAAQAELNHHAALRKLRSALHGALAEGSQRAAQVLAARILAETAVTEMSPRARRAAWLRAIDLLEACIAKDPSSSDAVGHYADVVVDASQDLYSDIHEPILRHHLAKARRRLQEWARTEHELLPAQKAYLLTRLSVVRRAQALSQLGFKERRTPLVEARNVASRALSIQSQNPMAQLELANCQWALLRYAETDAEYALQLGDVEVAFRAASASDESELVGLSLSRFFRLTHQSSRACDEFERVSENAQHRRRLLRESHVFAEAVQHLWYTGYPDIHVKPLLDRATQTLATAIDSGCHYARHIVDLATLHAMSGDLSLADTILTRDLITKDQRFDWNSLAKAITSPSLLDATKTDLAGLGFALGLNSPIILNKLGTYCRDFLDDRKLALTFYNASLRLDSRSSIALTNKARLLLDLGDAKDFKEVRALLDRARSYADRRYTWWRHELNRLITARDGALMPDGSCGCS